MKKIFVVFIGIVVAIITYAVWQTIVHDTKVFKVLVPKKEKVLKKESQKEKINSQKIIVTEVQDSESVKKSHLDMSNDIKEETSSIEKIENIQFDTIEKMQSHTQDIYDELTPDDYEETMEEATISFEKIDEYALELETKLSEEMREVEENKAIEEETTEDQINNEMEIDMDTME